ncbi:MAG: DUF6174 domain-containing protein [Myxococcales bacterium]
MSSRDDERWGPGARVLALVGCVGLAGCGNDFTEDVERAQSAWKAKRPADYVFVYKQPCFCLSSHIAPVRVTVTGGKILAATFADGTVAPDERRKTIDDLYDDAHAWAAGDPDEFHLATNPEFAYPTTVSVDEKKSTADDEFGISVDCFAASTSDDACPLADIEWPLPLAD